MSVFSSVLSTGVSVPCGPGSKEHHLSFSFLPPSCPFFCQSTFLSETPSVHQVGREINLLCFGDLPHLQGSLSLRGVRRGAALWSPAQHPSSELSVVQVCVANLRTGSLLLAGRILVTGTLKAVTLRASKAIDLSGKGTCLIWLSTGLGLFIQLKILMGLHL